RPRDAVRPRWGSLCIPSEPVWDRADARSIGDPYHRAMARSLVDFQPRERLAGVPHTTRRFACRSALALSPDGSALAVVSDQGAGTYEAFTLPATGGTPQRAITVEEHAVRSLCWS